MRNELTRDSRHRICSYNWFKARFNRTSSLRIAFCTQSFNVAQGWKLIGNFTFLYILPTIRLRQYNSGPPVVRFMSVLVLFRTFSPRSDKPRRASIVSSLYFTHRTILYKSCVLLFHCTSQKLFSTRQTRAQQYYIVLFVLNQFTIFGFCLFPKKADYYGRRLVRRFSKIHKYFVVFWKFSIFLLFYCRKKKKNVFFYSTILVAFLLCVFFIIFYFKRISARFS